MLALIGLPHQEPASRRDRGFVIAPRYQLRCILRILLDPGFRATARQLSVSQLPDQFRQDVGTGQPRPPQRAGRVDDQRHARVTRHHFPGIVAGRDAAIPDAADTCQRIDRGSRIPRRSITTQRSGRQSIQGDDNQFRCVHGVGRQAESGNQRVNLHSFPGLKGERFLYFENQEVAKVVKTFGVYRAAETLDEFRYHKTWLHQSAVHLFVESQLLSSEGVAGLIAWPGRASAETRCAGRNSPVDG